MPYIPQNARTQLNPYIETIANAINVDFRANRAQAFADTIFFLSVASRGGGHYANWNELAGFLTCTAAELRRRITRNIKPERALERQEKLKKWGPFPRRFNKDTFSLHMKLEVEKLAIAISSLEEKQEEDRLRRALQNHNVPHPHELILESAKGLWPINRAGYLNYAVTKLMILLNPDNNEGDWLALEEIFAGGGWMPQRIFQELYDTYIGPYEDTKIREEGDVYPMQKEETKGS